MKLIWLRVCMHEVHVLVCRVPTCPAALKHWRSFGQLDVVCTRCCY